MDKDILALMEGLTTQASDIGLTYETAMPAKEASLVEMPPFEDSLSTVCHRANVGQKKDRLGKVSSVSLCIRAEADGPGPDMAPEVSSDTNGRGEVAKKSSRKGRNRISKRVYLPWPLTLQTPVHSTSTFLAQPSVVGAVTVANVGQVSKKQREKGKNVVQSWQALESTLLTEINPLEPSVEAGSVIDSKEVQEKRHHPKRRAKKNESSVVSPWPLTIRAWASFMSPALEQTESLLADRVKPIPKSRYPEGKEDSISETLSKSKQAWALSSPATPVLASQEEVFLTANTETKKKSRLKRKGRKEGNALTDPWPLTVQAWASFTAEAKPAQTLSQKFVLDQENWPQLGKSIEKTKCFLPWSQVTEEDCPFSAIAPLQTSLKGAPIIEIEQLKQNNTRRNPDVGEEEHQQGDEPLLLEPYQAWGSTEIYLGSQDQHCWKYTVFDLTKQDDDFDFRDLFSHVGKEASTLTRDQAHGSTSEAGRQETEEDKVNSEPIWMRTWENF